MSRSTFIVAIHIHEVLMVALKRCFAGLRAVMI